MKTTAPADQPERVPPADPRFPALTRGMNQRYRSQPGAIHLVNSAEQVRVVTEQAVHRGERLAVRSGGHCFEDFVDHDQVEQIIDLSAMNAVYFDAEHEAYAVEPGARLLDVYEKLYRGWGVTIPGGLCFSVGAGGHIAGGGYGLLSRAHGLTVDHLHGVEVAVVNTDGRAELVTATRDGSAAERALWWGHTGGGGGNFGVVTRYLFRSPAEQVASLVRPPRHVLLSGVALSWSDLSRSDLRALLGNFTAWHARHHDPEDPRNALASMLMLNHRANGSIGMLTQIDSSDDAAEQLLHEFLDEVFEGVRAPLRSLDNPVGELAQTPGFDRPRQLPWWQATRLIGTNTSYLTDPTLRAEHKSAYGRGRMPDERIDVLHDHLTGRELENPDAMLVVMSYGGQINAIGPQDTASAQRDSHYKLLYQSFWQSERDDVRNIDWVRSLYEQTFADTGGVPAPGEHTDGCYINYPDGDLGNPVHNGSGVTWHDLYYKQNYARLREVKARWDPQDVFRHAQSIRLPCGDASGEERS